MAFLGITGEDVKNGAKKLAWMLPGSFMAAGGRVGTALVDPDSVHQTFEGQHIDHDLQAGQGVGIITDYAVSTGKGIYDHKARKNNADGKPYKSVALDEAALQRTQSVFEGLGGMVTDNNDGTVTLTGDEASLAYAKKVPMYAKQGDDYESELGTGPLTRSDRPAQISTARKVAACLAAFAKPLVGRVAVRDVAQLYLPFGMSDTIAAATSTVTPAGDVKDGLSMAGAFFAEAGVQQVCQMTAGTVVNGAETLVNKGIDRNDAKVATATMTQGF